MTVERSECRFCCGRTSGHLQLSTYNNSLYDRKTWNVTYKAINQTLDIKSNAHYLEFCVGLHCGQARASKLDELKKGHFSFTYRSHCSVCKAPQLVHWRTSSTSSCCCSNTSWHFWFWERPDLPQPATHLILWGHRRKKMINLVNFEPIGQL